MVRFFQWLIGVDPAEHVEGGSWSMRLLGWPGGDMALLILLGLALAAGDVDRMVHNKAPVIVTSQKKTHRESRHNYSRNHGCN